ncbi:glycosyltransferase family 2 protein [Streptomyces microflavus]|uniref:glycosyltransferase family 2 protein n=1 Tax=Streptomyces microflavus TaxID=1919 RepID=UPI0037F41DBB
MTRPDTAVITPTALHPSRRPYLDEAYESLRTQEDVSWEWILVLNGPLADPALVPRTITKDRRVHVVARPDPGPGPARNTGLNYVTADRVTFLDDDDRLPPTSLALRHQRAVDTGLRWVAGRSADWHADGTMATWINAVPTGHQPAGGIWTHWPSPEAGKPPLGHCMLLTDTRLARAVGNGGLVKGEDYTFVMGVCGRSSGELLPDVVYHRRVHAGQWTADDSYRDQAEFDARTHAWNQGFAERELRGLPAVG